MRVCDICKGGNSKELYVVHTAIYVNSFPQQVDDIPSQVNPNEAELCKNCYTNLERAMRDIKTIIMSHENSQKYVSSFYDSPGGRGRC